MLIASQGVTEWYKNSSLEKAEGINTFQNVYNPAGNYMFKVNSRNSRTKCEICPKLTIKTPKQRHCRRSGVFIVNFGHISLLVLVFLLLTLSK